MKKIVFNIFIIISILAAALSIFVIHTQLQELFSQQKLLKTQSDNFKQQFAAQINTSGIVSNGTCTPVPDCPNDGYFPAIYTTPIKFSGSGSSVYPIISVSVRASGAPAVPAQVPSCADANVVEACTSFGMEADKVIPGKKYWRVCMDVLTVNSANQDNTNNQPNESLALVMTRCVR